MMCVEEKKRFDAKLIAQYILLLVAVMWLSRVTNGAAAVVAFPCLFLWGAVRPRNLYIALMTSIALVMSNSFFVPKTVEVILTYRVITLGVGGVSLIWLARVRGMRYFTPFLLYYVYVIFMILPSSIGWHAGISMLKLLLFSFTFSCYYFICSRVQQSGPMAEISVRSMILSFAIVYILGSILLIPFPGISLLNPFDLDVRDIIARGVTLYKGMSMHSQSLGPMAAMLTVFIFADWLFCVRRISRLHLILLPTGLYVIYKTGSRTALGSALIGFVFGFLVLMLKQRGLPRMWKQKSLRLLLFAGLTGALVIVAVPSLRQGAVKFLVKFDPAVESSDMSLEEITKTRQGKFESTLYNFKESPIVGNGFQVSDDYAGLKIPVSHMISAPVEKGFFITAVLEEGGILGFLIFSLATLYVIYSLYYRDGYVALVVFLTMVVSNCGEFTMFSMTSTGGFAWAMVFSAALLDELCQRRDLMCNGIYYAID